MSSPLMPKAADARTPFSIGVTINYQQANYDVNSIYNGGPMGIYRQRTVDVGTFRPNAFALRDVHKLKPEVALYVGGMGLRDKNFHKDIIVRRGFKGAGDRIQQL